MPLFLSFRTGGGSMLGDVNISAILDSFSVSYDKRVRPNYGGKLSKRVSFSALELVLANRYGLLGGFFRSDQLGEKNIFILETFA